MNSSGKKISVTASGASESQGSATRSAQAGSRGSSSSDCRGAGVASLAPASLNVTSAVTVVAQGAESSRLSLVDLAKNSEWREASYLRDMQSLLEGLKTLMDKIKVEVVKQSFKKVNELIRILSKEREESQKLFRRAIGGKDTEFEKVKDNATIRDHLKSSKEKIINEIRESR